MAEQVSAPPLPTGTSVSPSKNKNGQAGPGQSHPRRNNNRHKKHPSQTIQQADGTVSDSITNPMKSQISSKTPKQRQQSVAIGAQSKENSHADKGNGSKARPVSLGGTMLPATPAKEQAYAGPTFQASPAPSSLPLPRFFSKSVPNVAAQQRSLDARVDGKKTPENEESSPEQEQVVPSRETQMSPLDLFFKADAAEREKSRSASMQSPEMPKRRQPPATEPRNMFQPNVDAGMPSPRTVPQSERPPPPQRIRSLGGDPSTSPSVPDNIASTKALKELLFNVSAEPSGSPPSASPRVTPNSRPNTAPYQTPPPFQRSTSGPSTPAPAVEQQNYYSLHYGNRNLSPLFKAARNDTPPSRPSGLRQHELAADASPASYRRQQPPPPQIDPDSFSRSYLDQQIRASKPATLPPMPFSNSTNISHTNNNTPGLVSQRGVSANISSPRTGGGSGTGTSVQDMEADLKRMLKINVMSN